MSLTPNQRDDMVGALRRAQTAVGNYGAARPWVEPIHLIVRVVEDLVNVAFDDDAVNERSGAIFGPRGTTKGLDVIRTASLLVSEEGENPEYDRALVEMVYDLTGIETSAQRLREIQQAQHPRQAEHRRAHIRKHTEVPAPDEAHHEAEGTDPHAGGDD